MCEYGVNTFVRVYMLIFREHPSEQVTSGLDAASALRIVAILKKIALEGIVVFVFSTAVACPRFYLHSPH
jgi:hypothetical protein